MSPLTLRPRNNTFADWTLDDATDIRLTTPFVAGWLIGVLDELIEAGADTVTVFETSGPRGVQSKSGVAYPVFAVLAELAAHRASRHLRCRSSEPLRIVGLAMDTGTALSVLAANLRPDPCTLQLHPPEPIGDWHVKRLSDLTSYGLRLGQGPAENVDPAAVSLDPFDVVLISSAPQHE